MWESLFPWGHLLISPGMLGHREIQDVSWESQQYIFIDGHAPASYIFVYPNVLWLISCWLAIWVECSITQPQTKRRSVAGGWIKSMCELSGWHTRFKHQAAAMPKKGTNPFSKTRCQDWLLIPTLVGNVAVIHMLSETCHLWNQVQGMHLTPVNGFKGKRKTLGHG